MKGLYEGNKFTMHAVLQIYNLQSYVKGVYFVRLESKDGFVVRRFLKE